MIEKEIKYMGNTLKYKEIEIPNKYDNYGRPLVIKVGRQSDAEQVTNEETGVKKWTAGAFFDFHINAYIKDEDYENADDNSLIALSQKIKI